MLLMPLWFLAGLAIGLIIVGFVALGSYERGYKSARSESFRAELLTRHRLRMTTDRRSSEQLHRQSA